MQALISPNHLINPDIGDFDSPDQRGEAELDILVLGHVLVLDEALLVEVLTTVLFLSWSCGNFLCQLGPLGRLASGAHGYFIGWLTEFFTIKSLLSDCQVTKT